MQQIRATHYIFQFLQQNWLKLSIGILLLLLAFKKEFSFNINFNPPSKGHIQQEEPIRYQQKREKRQTLTENFKPEKELAATVSPQTDKFNIPSILSLTGNNDHKAINDLAKVDIEVVATYLKRFAHVAEKEQKKFGIPASIVLANSLLMSKAGEHDLAQLGYNYFKIPCTPDWKGLSQNEGVHCYRKYPNAWTSFRDASLYLTTGKNSAFRSLKDKPYTSWAKALEQANYGNEPDLEEQLITIIEHFQLQALDN